ncbi:MAG: LptF/LptG family permease [Candidatus Omnitrophota bacterium]|jgi:lipopolysaccharide export system permease protein
MRILRNYVLKELFSPLAAALAVFTFVLLIGNIFKLADLMINKGVHIFDIMKLFFYLTPYILSYTIPMALLTATMICFSRLASDNEVIAMKASGISLYKIGLPVITVAFIISLASVYLNNTVLPASHYASYKLIKSVALKNPTACLEPGVFIKAFKGYIVRLDRIEGNKLEGVLIYHLQDNGPARTIIAEGGEFILNQGSGAITLRLSNGSVDEPNPDDPSVFYKLTFKTYDITLNTEKGISLDNIEKKPKSMTIKELKEDIAALKSSGKSPEYIKTNINERLTEIHRKISMAFSSFVFVLVALPLAINTKRREKSVGFAISLIVLVLYYFMLFGGMALALRNIIPPIAGVWAANIVYLIIGLVLTSCIIER